MQRTFTLSRFLVRDFLRSLIGAGPPALTLSLYAMTFTYPGDVDYFMAIGGACILVVCLVTTLLLADRVNRAATYSLLSRLPARSALLAAIMAGSLFVTVAMALLYTALALVQHKITLTPLEAGLIMPRWLALFIFTAALGLHMSKLVSRRGSHLLAYLLLGLLLSVADQRGILLRAGFGWLVDGAALVAGPITATLTQSVEWAGIEGFLRPLLLTLLYAGLLFALAIGLFRSKDLLWTE